MTDRYDKDETGGQESRESDLRSYLKGYLAALVLTVPPFALVAWGDLARATVLWIIAGCAVVQIAAHLRWFLHIRLKGQAFEDLQLILFSTLLLGLMAGGTIWIMMNLGTRMG